MHTNKINRRYSKWGYIFIIPFVAVFLVFDLFPLTKTVVAAFSYLKHAGNTDPVFLPAMDLPWYKNFAEIFKSKSFLDATKNTFLFFSVSTVLEWIISFWLAAMMTDRRLKLKGRSLFKLLFFFPKIVSGSILGSVILDGLIGFVANTIGLSYAASAMNGFGLMPEDFESLMSVRFFIIALTVFIHFGIIFIYVIAGITGIPVEIFEAAEIDGATRLQTFFGVTLPCMKPMLFFITVVSVVDGLGMVDIPYAFGSYDTLRRNLTLMMYLNNQAFMGSYAYDRAAAASLILLMICIVMAIISYFIFLYDRDEAKIKKYEKQKLKEQKELRKDLKGQNI